MRLAWVALCVAVDALYLEVVEPAPGSCALRHLAALATVLIEIGDDAKAISDAFSNADICFHVVRVAGGGNPKTTCIRGRSEAWLASLEPGDHDVFATATTGDDERLVARSATVRFAVADNMRCETADHAHPFPSSAAAANAFAAAEADRHGGARLQIEWPRPRSTVRSAVVVLAATVVHPGGTVEMLTGEACLSALDLGTLEHVRSCVFLNKTEFVEFGLPAAWLRGGTAHVAIALDVSSRTMTLPLDGLAAPPLELFVDAREHAPPLAIGVSTDGWILGRGAIERDSAAMTALPLCLVLCHWDEDLSWLRHQPYPAVVYEKQPRFRGVADSHSTPRNTANEASAYLQFVVDRYEALPMRMVFLHSHRYAYHQEDVLSLLHDLDPVADGYCNLNSAAWGTHEDPKRALLYETHREWVERHLGASSWQSPGAAMDSLLSRRPAAAAFAGSVLRAVFCPPKPRPLPAQVLLRRSAPTRSQRRGRGQHRAEPPVGPRLRVALAFYIW